jgi:hypothetical protein
MKQLKYFVLALAFGALVSTGALAQKGPGTPTGPSVGANHFGLSDSCWNVFLSGLSPADAAKLTADQTTIASNQTQINALEKSEDSLIRSAKPRDTAIGRQIKVLDGQIRTLNEANNTAQIDMGTIIKNNGTLLTTVAENCGKPKRDTGDHGRDTSKGGPGNGNNGPGDKGTFTKGHFGLSDSCWNIFISGISPANAASLSADLATIKTNGAEVDSLLKLIRSMKGAAKDSAGRAAIKALLDQINALIKSSGAAQKDYAGIIRANDSLLESIRKTCGRPGHKVTVGGGGNAPTASAITPNPASANGSASITITLDAAAEVEIFISNATAQGMPARLLFNGMLQAGATTESLSLTGLVPGAYVVTIQSQGTTLMQKLMIQ